MIEFKMPSLGADMEAGTLVEWFKQPGDTIHRGDVVALVETQKGAIEIEVFDEGVLGEHRVEPGRKVPVGTVIAMIIGIDEQRLDLSPMPTSPTQQPPRPATRQAISQPATRDDVKPKAAIPASPAPRVTPAARRRAAELGISLDTLVPGPDGVIGLAQIPTERLAGRAPERTPPSARPGLDLGEMRKAVASAMLRSHREIPHYWVGHSVNVSALFRWLETQNARRPVERRLLYVAPLMKAIALALKEVPELNGHYEDGRFRQAEAVHMGLATALRGGGLVSPAIRDADSRDVDELMAAIADLVPRARVGRLRSSEMTDGTVSLTNLGEGNAESVFPLIYPPQVAIIGCGAAALRPWAVGDAVTVRQVMKVTVAGDHRVSHGRHAAKFITRLAQLIERPEDL